MSNPVGLFINRIYRYSMAPFNRLPDFLLIGVNIGGTTSFFNNLADHPQVIAPLKKEVFYFNFNYQRGPLWYRTFFPSQFRTPIGKQSPWITGEGSTLYLYDIHAAQRAYQLLPQAKIITLLRNPVKRAYARYQKHIRENHPFIKDANGQTIPFHELVQHELKYLRAHPIGREMFEKCYNDIETRRSKKQLPHVSDNYTYSPYLLHGMYAVQLQRWYDVYPRQQILPLKSEDYFSNSAQMITTVARDFLGLLEWTPEYKPSRNDGNRYDAIQAAIYAELMDFFRPYNQALYELIGQDMGWESEAP